MSLAVRRWLAVPLAFFTLLPAAADAVAEQRPLPDPKAFTAAARARLLPDRELLAQYTYMERREEIDISPLGKVSVGPTKVYEVHPSIDSGNTWKRLISVDGKPLPPEELAENDRKHFEDVAKRQRASARERAKWAREEEKARRELEAVLDDLPRVYDIRLVKRALVDGHPTIEVALEPRPSAEPETKEGEMMTRVRIRAWIHEHEYELVRAHFEVIRDLTWAWGLVGRLHAGSTATYARTKVNDEIWLPSKLVIDATGRSLLFRAFDIESTTTWWGHRRAEGGRSSDARP